MLIAFKPLNHALQKKSCANHGRPKLYADVTEKMANIEHVSVAIENYSQWIKNGSKLCETKN